MEDISKRSLKITRQLNAPVELLWKVLTTPDYIKNWWGPDGFTNSIRKMEVLEGGHWEFTMHGPDGTDYENEYIYREIVPLKKIVLEHLKDPNFTIIIQLSEKDEQTEMEWQNIFATAAGLEQAVKMFKADEGLKQNLLRLAVYVENLNE